MGVLIMSPDRQRLFSFCLCLLLVHTRAALEQWVVMGGYTGIEGQDQEATAAVELLTLEDGKFSDKSAWCQRNLSVAPLPLDGATINVIDIFNYYDRLDGTGNVIADINPNTDFSGAHYTVQLNRVLVCGGADDKYAIQSLCRWWIPGTDSWLEGPKMLYPRYQATAVVRPVEGQLWMLGGRAGSRILQDNEVLQYPATFSAAKRNYVEKRWEWANSKMKNSDVWISGVPDNMKSLPMPLAGHCTVELKVKELVEGVEKTITYIVTLGGGTTEVKEDGVTFIENTGPIPSDHVHVYSTAKGGQWSSTFTSDLVTGKRPLKKSKIPRMNHGCVTYVQGGKHKIMVAGGVTFTSSNQAIAVNKVEVMDFETGNWILEANFPNVVTGTKLIKIQDRPVVVGRYGNELTNRMIRYSENKIWEPLPVSLMVGRSDFQLLQDMPATFIVNPNMNSKLTKMVGGSGASDKWRNKFLEILKGVRTVIKTNKATGAWIQLDLGEEMKVQQVYFESGLISEDTLEYAAQLIEVKVGSDQVPPTEENENEACATEINGVDKKTTICKKLGRLVTLQLKDDTLDQLHIRNIKIKVSSPECPAPVSP